MCDIKQLCQSGFYGVGITEENAEELEELAHESGAEVVTKESVEEVKRELDPDLFIVAEKSRYTGRFRVGDRIRATNQKFMEYVTKNRFKFNCKDYYFVFNELLTRPGGVCSCAEMRKDLKIGAKSFFYYVKKLCGLKLIEKTDNQCVRIVEKELDADSEEEAEDSGPPTSLLKNVPIYLQVLRMVQTKEKGVCTNDLKEWFGMKNKRANQCLNKILEDNRKTVTVTIEFEGKIRRKRYMLKEYNEKQKRAFVKDINREKEREEADGGEALGVDTSAGDKKGVVSIENRTKAIENLVMKTGVVMYKKEFHEKLSEMLRSKHMIDKKTVIRTANSSSKINAVKVFVKYKNKTVTRNVFKDASIPDTDERVIEVIAREGYTAFTLVSGIFARDYVLETHAERESDSGSRGKDEARAYFKKILSHLSGRKDAAESNGYLMAKEARMRALLAFWKASGAEIKRSAGCLSRLPLSLFFSVFPILEKNYRKKIQKHFAKTQIDWKQATFSDLCTQLPQSLAKKATPKTYMKTLREYLEEMHELGFLEKSKTVKDVYALTGKEPAQADAENGSLLSPQQRKEMLQNMCRKMKERTSHLGTKNAHEIKQIALGVATDEIRRLGISLRIKREFFNLIKKRMPLKKSYPCRLRKISGLSVLSPDAEVLGAKHSVSEISRLVSSIKEKLARENEIDFLESYTHEDYFLLEHVVLCLAGMGVLFLSKLSVRLNSICAFPVRITEEYKKHGAEEISYSGTFFIPRPFHKPPEEDNLHFNSFFVYKHLIHRGASEMSSIQKEHPFLCLFEIEEVCEKNSEIFSIARSASGNPTEAMVMLKSSVVLGSAGGDAGRSEAADRAGGSADMEL